MLLFKKVLAINKKMENTKKIILVADDDEDLLELSMMALTTKGFEVLQAKDGKEVMEWLERKSDQISLVLLDIVMPEMDGFEVLEKMQKNEKYRKIPVIVCSNLDNDADRQTVFSLGETRSCLSSESVFCLSFVSLVSSVLSTR